MIAKRLITNLIAAAALALTASQAHATAYVLDLTGTVANGSFSSQNCCGSHFDQWFLSLSGLDPNNAITVSQGDTFDVTVTLDQAMTIPASQQRTNIGFFLFGSAFPSVNTGTTGSISLFNAGNPVFTGSATTTTSSQLASTVDIFPPFNTAYTFDKLTTSFTVYDLSLPAVLDSSAMDYSLVSALPAPVPEPGAWALMLIGVGGLGAAMRSRRKAAVATA